MSLFDRLIQLITNTLSPAPVVTTIQVTVRGQQVVLPLDRTVWTDEQWQDYYDSDALKTFVVRDVSITLPADVMTWTDDEQEVFAYSGWPMPEHLPRNVYRSDVSPEVIELADILVDEETAAIAEYEASLLDDDDVRTELDYIDDDFERQRLNDDAFYEDQRRLEDNERNAFYDDLWLQDDDYYNDQPSSFDDDPYT